MHRARMEMITRFAVRVYVHRRALGAAVVAIVATALNGACVLDTKTNLCEASGRRCPPGQVCAVDQDACIPIGGCGDGIVSPEKGEICDDGNIRNGDGCSSDCRSDTLCGNGVIDRDEDCDAGVDDSPGCDDDCTFVRCGDGHVNKAAGEDCDTGDPFSNTEKCNGLLCKTAECGDSIYNAVAGEECDTGGNSQACNGKVMDNPQSCQIPACGDGYWNIKFVPPYPMSTPLSARLPEACDDGGSTSGCNGNDGDNDGFVDNGMGSCQIPRCGDSYTNPNYPPTGGSGPGEACDDGSNSSSCNGNDANHDGMSDDGPGSCQLAKCGDNYTNPLFHPTGPTGPGEACDDGDNSSSCNGNDSNHDGTPDDGVGSCQLAKCGDGYTNPLYKPTGPTGPGEACDVGVNTVNCNGNDSDNNGTPDVGIGSCQVPRCGDGYTNPLYKPTGPMGPGEACDTRVNTKNCNGNDRNNDGMPDEGIGSCQVSSCGDGYVNPQDNEMCDKGGPGIPAIGCSSGQICKNDCSACVSP